MFSNVSRYVQKNNVDRYPVVQLTALCSLIDKKKMKNKTRLRAHDLLISLAKLDQLSNNFPRNSLTARFFNKNSLQNHIIRSCFASTTSAAIRILVSVREHIHIIRD